ncbi:hypothetical protein MAPG_10502, partial [Magnaporthiopsis poae ATCC 64411]
MIKTKALASGGGDASSSVSSNLRALAKQYRDGFIQAANEKARRTGEENPAAADTAVVQQDERSSPDEFVDCDEFPLDALEGASGPHPQQNFVGVGDHTRRQAIPQHLIDNDDDRQDDSQSPVPFELQNPEAGVETSFTSSFASSFPSHPPARGHGSRSKRARNSQSPPSEPHIADDHHKAGPAHPATGDLLGGLNIANRSDTPFTRVPFKKTDDWAWLHWRLTLVGQVSEHRVHPNKNWLPAIPKDIGIVVIELMNVSNRIAPEGTDYETFANGVAKILLQQNMDDFVLMGHSYGTTLARPLLSHHAVGPKINSLILSILLHLPDVTYNATRRPPETTPQVQIDMITKDPLIAHTLCRRFHWPEAILF